jgi:hypothetical protein
MDDNIFEIMLAEQQKQELARVLECNTKTAHFGLILSEEEAKGLIQSRKAALADSQRVEFAEGILPKLIHYFCDSQYINQDNYGDTLAQLQDLFYQYKNETQDELTDDELLEFMRKQFEDVCFGDLDYLASTCLERYSRAVRSGYQSGLQKRLRDEYSLRESEDIYGKLTEETGWDYELYKSKLDDLF